MKKIISNTFVLALVMLIIFRIFIYFIGLGKAGNFLILDIVPLLIFWLVISLIKYIYSKLTIKTKSKICY